MPVLTITYGDLTLFDGDVAGIRFEDTPGHSVTVTGQMAKEKTSGGGGLSAVVDMLAQASKAKTEEKRRLLAEHATEVEVDDVHD